MQDEIWEKNFYKKIVSGGTHNFSWHPNIYEKINIYFLIFFSFSLSFSSIKQSFNKITMLTLRMSFYNHNQPIRNGAWLYGPPKFFWPLYILKASKLYYNCTGRRHTLQAIICTENRKKYSQTWITGGEIMCIWIHRWSIKSTLQSIKPSICQIPFKTVIYSIIYCWFTKLDLENVNIKRSWFLSVYFFTEVWNI